MMRCFVLAGVLLLLFPAALHADEVDDAIQSAWQTWQAGDREAGRAALEAVKAAHPRDVRPNARLAYVLLMADGELERVFELLIEHLEVHRNDTWAADNLEIVAERALGVGRPELARNCAKRLKAMRPGVKEHRYLWARASYRLGETASVAQACRGLVDDYPSWELPYWLLARTYEDQGEYEEVVRVYRDLLKELPGSVDARLRIANARLMQRQYDQAEDSYRSALELAEAGSDQREEAEWGISVVRSQRELSRRLREQDSFLSVMLLVVCAAWSAIIVGLLVATKPRP
jgi:tetratricopeptide (TPR) repeat protein